MPKESLKRSTIKGVAWNGLENFANIGLRFLFGVILARLLGPSDYGIVGMLTVFLAVSDVFVNSGFSSALIRKIDRTEVDNSTAFFFNIIIGVIAYISLFFLAPCIARFYNLPILVPVTRVLGVVIILHSFSVVQNALLSIRLDFKTSAIITLISGIISGIVGISLAYLCYGVWSLVFQSIILALSRMILLWVLSKWKPLICFSWDSFKALFGFGSRLLLSGLLETVYANIYPIIIGKLFTSVELGLYSRASSYSQLPSTHLTNVIQKVAFPVLSKIQDDEVRLAINYRKILRMSAFVIFPCMICLMSIADPLIRWMLTDTWKDCVILLQILCLSMMWFPIHAINLTLLQVKGRSDLFLRLEIIKKTIGILVILISFRWGLIGLCIGAVVTSIISVIINTYYTGKLISVGYFEQMKDVFPIIIISCISGFLSYLLTQLSHFSNFFTAGLGLVVFLISYLIIAYLIRVPELTEIKSIIKNENKLWKKN